MTQGETPMNQKIAIVTGAGTGVGRAAALALMREGYTVVLAGRRQEMLDAVAKEGAQTPGAALTVQADVADPASIKALFAKTREVYGRLDLLFNNAGIGTPATSIEDMPFDKWQAVVATNLTGVFLCTQEAIKIMKAQDPRGGRIINNGSISAHTPRPGAAPSPLRMVKGAGVPPPAGRKMIEPRMAADDVGRAVVCMASLPLDTNVLFMTVMANLMPFVGRG